jgi:xylulose-5-phosphate/fructose-6-phosphate phosphoketolase
MAISKEELDWAVKHWTTANYITAASIYLQDNFLLERKIKPTDIKDKLVGHWGTCPGLNFIYTHLNLLAAKTGQSILPVIGPGHGFAAILANMFIDRTLQKYYPEYSNDKKGIGKTMKAFCWPGGFPSHANPGTPGVIHEGGELGYALGTAYGAAFDNPDLLAVAVIGDGEAETAATATAWHSNKFLNPKRDGAVLPILHLNGYKIGGPTIFATMSDNELKMLFSGYGYEPKFVGENHKQMADALQWAYKSIKGIQKSKSLKPRWPMIILKTKKGWTGPKKDIDGKPIEGSFRSHQVPIKDVRTSPKSMKILESWLRSYKPEKLFKNGKVPEELLKFVPEQRITDNPHAIGGNKRKPLLLPGAKQFEVRFRKRGESFARSTAVMGEYLKKIFELNKNNFRIMSPDELESNKLGAVLDVTKRAYVWPHSGDDGLSPDGRVMEILSEHTLQSWLQGYVLTGRHGLLPSYEAFLPMLDSMVAQHLKFLKASLDVSWRKPVPAMNYLLTSVCWRQDHNGFSHQNPGFINTFLEKSREEQLVRVYLPADANMLLTTTEHVLNSTNRVNIIVSDKQLIREWLTYDEAMKQAKTGASVWAFASDSNPDVVLAAAGDYQTQEGLAAIKLLKKYIPEIKIRFVNVSELNVLGISKEYANSLNDSKFNEIFTKDNEVLFMFHGYPETIKQLLFDRPNTHRFHVHGYSEAGTTTTPFDMLIRNKVDRYNVGIELIEKAAKVNPKVAKKASSVISALKHKIAEHKKFIEANGMDPEEVNAWTW